MIAHIGSIVFSQGQLNEDKLKCKLRALENQLQACTQVMSDCWETNMGEEKHENKIPNHVIRSGLSF